MGGAGAGGGTAGAETCGAAGAEERADQSMVITLREAVPGDEAAILRLVRALAEYEREPEAVKACAADFTAALFGADAVAGCVLAEVDGAAVGLALWFRNFSTWTGRSGLYLEDLFVEPHARGLGVGRALLVHLAGIAVSRGWARFEWSVLDWNAPAIGFYRALGARPMDEWTVMRLEGEALRRLAEG